MPIPPPAGKCGDRRQHQGQGIADIANDLQSFLLGLNCKIVLINNLMAQPQEVGNLKLSRINALFITGRYRDKG